MVTGHEATSSSRWNVSTLMCVKARTSSFRPPQHSAPDTVGCLCLAGAGVDVDQHNEVAVCGGQDPCSSSHCCARIAKDISQSDDHNLMLLSARKRMFQAQRRR